MAKRLKVIFNGRKTSWERYNPAGDLLYWIRSLLLDLEEKKT